VPIPAQPKPLTPASFPIAPGGKKTYILLLIYLALIFSRILDFAPSALHIPLVTLILMCISLLLSGNALRLLSSRTGVLLCIFVAWLGITAVTGVWWGGSLPSVESAVLSLGVVFVLVGALTTAERIKRTLFVIGFCSLVAALLSYVSGGSETGRLALSSGSFRDPNAYAMRLIMGVPLLFFFVKRVRSTFWKLFALAGVILILRTALYTGSRGALVAMAALALLLFFGLPGRQKILLLISAVVMLPVGYGLLPEYLKLRYLTLFTNDVQTTDNQLREQVEGGDMGSTESRLALLNASIRMTLQHPFFGVGPGDFATENFEVVKRETGRKVWLVSHNSYTQVSSETGIPGFLIFATLLVLSLRNSRKLLRAEKSHSPPQPLLVDCARYLNVTILTICTAAFFLSIAYEELIFILIGLSVAVERLYSLHVADEGVTPPTSRPNQYGH
jgi:putative inorganic carbon (HCO3(-)) transporter